MQAVQVGAQQLQILAAAVTPVVLVSAAAILISGVNSRYVAIADRMRALAHEFRESSDNVPRREMIAKQMIIFRTRVRLVSWAERTLYVAVACFTSVALMISAMMSRELLAAISVPVFITGLALIMIAISLQLLELQFANLTLEIETGDIRPVRR